MVNIAIKRNKARLVPIVENTFSKKQGVAQRTYWVDPDKIAPKQQQHNNDKSPQKVLAQRILYILRETKSTQGRATAHGKHIGTKREYRVFYSGSKKGSETSVTG